MADEKMEFETDVVTMADAVEVQTIAEGQALKNEAPDLDFIVQEEVETTTEGPPHLTEEDPVKNVLLSLQQSAGGGHDREEDMAEGEGEGEEDGGKVLEIRVDDDEEYSPGGETGRKKSRSSRRKGKRKKLSSRRSAISASPQEAREDGELKRSGRKWARSKLQIQTLATGEWPKACSSCAASTAHPVCPAQRPTRGKSLRMTLTFTSTHAGKRYRKRVSRGSTSATQTTSWSSPSKALTVLPSRSAPHLPSLCMQAHQDEAPPGRRRALCALPPQGEHLQWTGCWQCCSDCCLVCRAATRCSGTMRHCASTCTSTARVCMSAPSVARPLWRAPNSSGTSWCIRGRSPSRWAGSGGGVPHRAVQCQLTMPPCCSN